ncbi:hypothetical protein [Melissospora conviva]|uniref:hypothetical protein n=1 Tax=Melissospora conviva TaxID=3388432 RepID=UPI003C1F5FD1
MEINLVPRGEVTFEGFSRFARDHGWRIDDRAIQAAAEEESPEFVWQAGEGGRVRLIQSATLGRSYLVVSGDDATVLAAPIRDAFPVFSEAEIVNLLDAARSDDDRIAALGLAAAAGFARYDDRVYKAVRAAMEETDALVRLAALTAAFYLRWRQFEPLVERLGESADASENVRITARNLLGLTYWDRG